jgi:hypothetical protein
MYNNYDVEDMLDLLADAINHLENAENELLGVLEFEGELSDIMDIRKGLQHKLDEANEILAKQQAEEQRELEREFDRMRL